MKRSTFIAAMALFVAAVGVVIALAAYFKNKSSYLYDDDDFLFDDPDDLEYYGADDAESADNSMESLNDSDEETDTFSSEE